MKIADSQLSLSAAHHRAEHHQKQEQLRYWRDGDASVELRGQQAAAGLTRFTAAQRINADASTLNISSAANALQPRKALLTPASASEPENNHLDLDVSLLKALMEKFTGREIKLFNPADFTVDSSGAQQSVAAPASEESGAEPDLGWGLVYDAYESHHEVESSHFSAVGKVLTTDGQEIDVQAELNLSREFFSEQRLSIRAGDALKDPLVVNFNGSAAQLTQRNFRFDLDLDGRLDQVAFVGPNSGFLALDKNANGKVDDGGELFGPNSGDGFAELARHDVDGNRWIDENDPVYEKLRIWSKDEQGQDQLLGLGKRGVGAIYLGHVATPFDLKDDNNQLLGQVRSSGLYLDEEGKTGTVQQVDLVI
jgi:hypothetical protein